MKLYKREKYLSKMRAFFHVFAGNIIYIDLDKRGYKNIRTAEQLDDLIASSTQMAGMKYIFIDEIQNVDGFEKVINGFRSEGEYSIFITGSNSYLLSGELVTKLTGRYLEFESDLPEYFKDFLADLERKNGDF